MLFFRQVMVAFVFFRILVSVIFVQQKIHKNGAGFPFVGWCMMNTASKNHIKIRKIERGRAKQRLWQHLSWPSSCTRYYSYCILFICSGCALYRRIVFLCLFFFCNFCCFLLLLFLVRLSINVSGLLTCVSRGYRIQHYIYDRWHDIALSIILTALRGAISVVP